tara:strand:+ start:775 stop:966 length:192 start_codon:yes stop_codon:yes gene_type:complete
MFILNLITALFGFILGIFTFLIYNKFINRNKYHGPNSNIIRKEIYKYKDKYYMYEPVICPCPL